ncbi:cupin domain-containing protein [Actinoplanes sp. NPDC051494]|uniref:AraC family transcriptional regulator n=1 Tax=Actinoplanes sp. NPDC051494 TaxID=3363907 RepID=UPI0037B5AAC1
MDILQEHLVRARATGGVFARSVAAPPWGLRMPGEIQLAVHAVTRGHAWIRVDDGTDPIELEPGDLALVKGGADHIIAHRPDAEALTHDEFAIRHPADTEPIDPDSSVFLCGAYRFPGDIGRSLVDALPQLLRLRASADDPVQGVVALVSREMVNDSPGKQTVLDRLLDILVVYGLRTGLTQSTSPPPWLRAASDPRLTAALHAIHSSPDTAWTVDELAGLSAMSRASFARVFRAAVGQSPMQYLSDWRMTLARDYLSSGTMPLAHIAAKVGFSSVYAFGAAFRRHHNEAPGQWRRRTGTSATR